MTIRVLLADDEPLVRTGIAMLIAADPEIEVVGEVGDGQAAVDAAVRACPDVVVMDVRMPRMDGVEATRRIMEAHREGHPPAAVLVLTTFNLDEAVYAALRAGASGFLLKDAAPSELLDAIKALARGEGWLDPAVTRLLIREFATRSTATSPGGEEPTPRPAQQRAAPAESVFRMEGEFWTIAYEREVIRLKDSIGLRYLSHLLAEPGREFHVLDLARLARGLPPDRVPAGGGGIGRPGVHVGPGHAGRLLDDRARSSYRQRIAELQAELQEAEAWADVARASGIREELEILADELARAVGLGGRDRVAASDAERARVSVTKAIWGASRRIGQRHRPLGRHLERSVRTGTYCCYEPEAPDAVAWQL